MHHDTSLRLCLSLCACLFWCALPAFADITFGPTARQVAMGGAGLASGDAQESLTNPAFLAQSGARFSIQWPTVDARMQGQAGLSDALDLLGSPKIDPLEALSLVTDLGRGPTQIDATASTGLLLPHIDLIANAAVRTLIVPNSDFADWVIGGTANPLPALAQADVTSVGIATLPSLGFAFHLPSDTLLPGSIALGVRVKPTQVYYSHYTFDITNLDASGMPIATPGVEMGGRSYLRDSSLSADLGLLYTPAGLPNMRVALMVNNLIEPNPIDFGVPSPLTGMLEHQVAPRTVSFGAAWVNSTVTLAADLVDITDSFADPELRLGGELRLPLGIALRGGYNSHNGFTGGFGFGGFAFAYSDTTPLTISQTVSF